MRFPSFSSTFLRFWVILLVMIRSRIRFSMFLLSTISSSFSRWRCILHSQSRKFVFQHFHYHIKPYHTIRFSYHVLSSGYRLCCFHSLEHFLYSFVIPRMAFLLQPSILIFISSHQAPYHVYFTATRSKSNIRVGRFQNLSKFSEHEIVPLLSLTVLKFHTTYRGH